jgi:ferredoxin
VESPDFFDIDDTGKVIALTDSPDSGRFDEVRRATASCPVRAIGLQE